MRANTIGTNFRLIIIHPSARTFGLILQHFKLYLVCYWL